MAQDHNSRATGGSQAPVDERDLTDDRDLVDRRGGVVDERELIGGRPDSCRHPSRALTSDSPSTSGPPDAMPIRSDSR